MEEMQIWPEVLVVLLAAFVGVRGASRPGTPVARSGTGTMTETSSLVFVSPGPSNNLPSIPIALFPLRFAFNFAISAILRFLRLGRPRHAQRGARV
jgi:hypothetical protein